MAPPTTVAELLPTPEAIGSPDFVNPRVSNSASVALLSCRRLTILSASARACSPRDLTAFDPPSSAFCVSFALDARSAIALPSAGKTFKRATTSRLVATLHPHSRQHYLDPLPFLLCRRLVFRLADQCRVPPDNRVVIGKLQHCSTLAVVPVRSLILLAQVRRILRPRDHTERNLGTRRTRRFCARRTLIRLAEPQGLLAGAFVVDPDFAVLTIPRCDPGMRQPEAHPV